MSKFLEKVGFFVQIVLTTNTFKVLIRQIAKAYYGPTFDARDPRRNQCCAGIILLVGGGGIPLFILIPTLHDYFGPIVEQMFPFVGKVGGDIGVGLIGFWIMGSIAFNAMKLIYCEFLTYQRGYRNDAYVIDDKKVERIIEANPLAYQYEFQNKKELTEASKNQKKMDIAELTVQLINIRNKMDKYREGTKRYTDYQYILDSALIYQDLMPLFEQDEIDAAKRRVRTGWLSYLIEKSTEKSAGHPLKLHQQTVIGDPSEGETELEKEEIVEMGEIDEIDEKREYPPEEIIEMENIPIYSNAFKRLNELNYGYPISRNYQASSPFHEQNKNEIIANARQAIQREEAKRSTDVNLFQGRPTLRRRFGLSSNG